MSYAGKNIKYLRELHELSQAEMGKIAGVTDKAVSTWEADKKEPRMGAIQKIADRFNLKISSIIDEPLWTKPSHAEVSGLLSVETQKIPLLGEIACGELRYAPEEFEGYVECGALIQVDFALRCVGDSMKNARIYDGDIVFIRKQPTVNNGEIAAVLYQDEASLKRFRRVGNTVILSPENPDYEDIVIDLDESEEVRILGKAIAFQGNIR